MSYLETHSKGKNGTNCIRQGLPGPEEGRHSLKCLAGVTMRWDIGGYNQSVRVLTVCFLLCWRSSLQDSVSWNSKEEAQPRSARIQR